MKLTSTCRQTDKGTFVTVKGSDSNVALVGVGREIPTFPKAVMVEREKAVAFAQELVKLLNKFEV